MLDLDPDGIIDGNKNVAREEHAEHAHQDQTHLVEDEIIDEEGGYKGAISEKLVIGYIRCWERSGRDVYGNRSGQVDVDRTGSLVRKESLV